MIFVADFLIRTTGISLAFPVSKSLIICDISSGVESSRKIDFSQGLLKYEWNEGNEASDISLYALVFKLRASDVK